MLNLMRRILGGLGWLILFSLLGPLWEHTPEIELDPIIVRMDDPLPCIHKDSPYRLSMYRQGTVCSDL